MALLVIKLPILMVLRILEVVVVALLLTWTVHYRGGLVQPVMMVIGPIIICGEAMLVNKTVPGTKCFEQLVHLSLQFLGFCIGFFGVWAALKFHNERRIDSFYSLHYWLGLTCLSLVGLQWTTGFATVWYPGGSGKSRARLLPWHVFFGVFIYALAIATVDTGLLEKASFLQTENVISLHCCEALLVNSLGILIVVLGGLVVLATVAGSKRDGARNRTE